MSYDESDAVENDLTDIPAPPEGLSPRALMLWNSVLSEYELRQDGLVILESACNATTRIEEFEREFGKDGDYVTVGSRYQPIINPLLSEIRATEKHVADLLAKLKLGQFEEDQKPEDFTIIRAKKAANTRWGSQKGE